MSAHFWVHDAVVTVEGYVAPPDAADHGVLECLCVDASYSVTEPTMRYGMYEANTWVKVPLTQFPKEFLVQLLLLGVPT